MNGQGTSERTVSVHVYRHGAEYLVRPAVVAANGGDSLRFSNLTDQRLTVFFPHRGFEPAVLHVEARGESQLPLPAVKDRALFPYAVYCEEARDFCRGESSPGVIIEK